MDHFEIMYGLVIIKVTALDGAGSERYKVQFPNEVPDIVIERNADAANCWDTVPAGNPELGEAIGKLVDEHLNSSC